MVFLNQSITLNYVHRLKVQRREQQCLAHRKDLKKLKRTHFLKSDQEASELVVILDQKLILLVLLDGQNIFFSKDKKEFFYKDLRFHQYLTNSAKQLIETKVR